MKGCQQLWHIKIWEKYLFPGMLGASTYFDILFINCLCLCVSVSLDRCTCYCQQGRGVWPIRILSGVIWKHISIRIEIKLCKITIYLFVCKYISHSYMQFTQWTQWKLILFYHFNLPFDFQNLMVMLHVIMINGVNMMIKM